MSDLRKILAAATPGPWGFSFESVDPEWAIVTTHGGSVISNVNGDHRQDANVRLIALAPDLATEVLALRDENAKLREALSGLRVTGPNSDGEVWLHYTCPKTGLSGGMNLGGPDRIAVKAFLRLQAALSDIKAITGGGNG